MDIRVYDDGRPEEEPLFERIRAAEAAALRALPEADKLDLMVEYGPCFTCGAPRFPMTVGRDGHLRHSLVCTADWDHEA